MARLLFRKGKHKAEGLHLTELNFSQSEQFIVTFDDSCLYTPANWENDSNKLGGFTLGLLPKRAPTNATFKDGDKWGWLFPVHHNSCRLAWAPQVLAYKDTDAQFGKSYLTGKIELFLYLYEQGIRRQVSLGLFEINKEYEINLLVNSKEIQVFCLDMQQYPRSFTHSFSYVGPGFECDAYIGGNDPAQQDIHLELE